MEHRRGAPIIPFARGIGGRLVYPHEAESGAEYSCPVCGGGVVLRSGSKRRAHFAHRGASCAPDSSLHRSAKALVAEVVRAWKSGVGPRPSIFRPCPRSSCDGGIVQDLPEDVTDAVIEARLASGHVGDVLLFRGSNPAVVIEILATSPVSAEKAGRLELPWVELGAEDLLERPYWWVALQDGLRPFTCPACEKQAAARAAELQDVRQRAEEVARRAGVGLTPNLEYHPAPHVCWRCSAEMIVYAWPGSGKHVTSRPPEPIPSSVQQRWTDGAGHYWANCCPACSAVQGDYHLGVGNPEYARVRETLRERSIWRPE